MIKWLLLTPQDIAKILGQRRRDRAVEFVLNDHKCRTAILIGLEGRLRGNATAKTASAFKAELRQFNGHTKRWDTKEGIAVKERNYPELGLERKKEIILGVNRKIDPTELCACPGGEAQVYTNAKSRNWFCGKCGKRVLVVAG